jgi:DNA-binding LacI/PurR family transcriptional regulator
MNKMKHSVTIRDVAAAAGVSHQTVSRVINDRPDVAQETRNRVWRIIKELDYQPSAIARSLSSRRSHTLGVVTAGLNYVGPSRTLNGITRQAEEMGYTLLLQELPHFQANDIEPIINSLLARRVDGILWAVPEIGDSRHWVQVQPLGQRVPVLFLTMQARPDLFVVSMDNYAGGRMATEHLVQQGRRRIGHISGPLDWWEARQRKAGWHDALVEAGIEVAEYHSAPGKWSAASGERAFRRLLASYGSMDGVFVANDQMALGLLQAAGQAGLDVPHDLAVVGFDGIPEAAYYWPPLTTVYHDLGELGSRAVRELVEIVEARHDGDEKIEPRAVSLHPELIVRASSVCSPD